jgi:hypothetical protein
MYLHGRPEETARTEIKVEALPGESPFAVVFGPAVSGEEHAANADGTYRVRWLKNETDFVVENETGNAQKIVIMIEVATFAQPRHVNLAANGRRLAEVYEITHDFWTNGAQTARFATSLGAGTNRFSLKTDEPAGLLPGNRPACLLLVGDVHVELRK